MYFLVILSYKIFFIDFKFDFVVKTVVTWIWLREMPRFTL